MALHFATNERWRALGFLRTRFPNAQVQDEGDVSAFLDLVDEDIVRLEDPMMHPTMAIIPSSKYDPGRHMEIFEKCQAMERSLSAAG